MRFFVFLDAWASHSVINVAPQEGIDQVYKGQENDPPIGHIYFFLIYIEVKVFFMLNDLFMVFFELKFHEFPKVIVYVRNEH